MMDETDVAAMFGNVKSTAQSLESLAVDIASYARQIDSAVSRATTPYPDDFASDIERRTADAHDTIRDLERALEALKSLSEVVS